LTDIYIFIYIYSRFKRKPNRSQARNENFNKHIQHERDSRKGSRGNCKLCNRSEREHVCNLCNIHSGSGAQILVVMEQQPQSERERTTQIKQAFEMGLKIVIKQPKEGKPRTEAPLFNEFNSTQAKLF